MLHTRIEKKSRPLPHGADSPKGRQVRNPAMITKGGQGTPKRDVYRDSENTGQNADPEDTSKIQNPHSTGIRPGIPQMLVYLGMVEKTSD